MREGLKAVALAVLLTAPAGQAAAWGSTGHRIVGVLAMQALPDGLPLFLRTPDAVVEVGELSREPDRSKGAGKLHDSDRDAAHFVDVDDAGLVFGGPPLAELPPTREAYETALRAAGKHSWTAGYLPYALIDRSQQLTQDFAYWRIAKAGAAFATSPERRAWLDEDRRRREALILKTLGELSHFVGDGAQPLHVSLHYNGWGDYPNPRGYTRARIHGPFEAELVRTSVDIAQVRAAMRPYRDCDCALEARVTGYLTDSWKLVEPLYQLEKAGGLKPGDPRGPAFATERLAVGASELRDLIVMAWKASDDAKAGWKPVKVADVEAGKVDPFDALHGTD
jgi:hypothetical protein